MNKRQLPISTSQYSYPAMFFHWTLAILIPTLIGLGWYMMAIEKEPGSSWYFNLHKSLGITAAILVILRLSWRIRNTPASLPDTLPAWQATAAKFSHALLYLLMLLMPLTGYLGASFSGDGVAYFGLPIPEWASKNDALKEQFFAAHSIIAWILVGFISIHILGALKHLWINKDDVFQRMLP